MEKLFLSLIFKINIGYKMSFFIIIYIKINFLEIKLFKRTYILIKLILTSNQFQLIEKKEFLSIALDVKEKSYIIYISNLFNFNSYIYFC